MKARQVLECGRPLLLSVSLGAFQSGRGLPHSKTLPRWAGRVLLLSLLDSTRPGWPCCGQPPHKLTDETSRKPNKSTTNQEV
jgi:hypothetical protein